MDEEMEYNIKQAIHQIHGLCNTLESLINVECGRYNSIEEIMDKKGHKKGDLDKWLDKGGKV